MKTTRQILYQKVEDARESCAGCHPLLKQDLLKKIEKAMDYALEVEAPGEIISKLHKAKDMVNRSEGFDTVRVEADQILADILNTDLATKKEKIKCPFCRREFDIVTEGEG